MSFGRLLTLHNSSPFGDKAIIQRLMVLSGGSTGKITSLLLQAAELAIRRTTESITPDLLIDAAAAGIFKTTAEQEIDDPLGVCAAEGFHNDLPNFDLSEMRRSVFLEGAKGSRTLEITTFCVVVFCRADS